MVIVSGILAIISPVVGIVSAVEVGRRAPACHPRQGVAMSERNYALRFSETNGVGVVAVFAKVVASPAVVAVPSCWTIPDHVLWLELVAKAAAMGEWSGSG